MSERTRSLATARHMKESGRVRLSLRKLWSWLRREFVRLEYRARRRRFRHKGVDRPMRWQSSPFVRLATWIVVLLAVLFLVWLSRAAVVFVRGRPVSFPFGFDLDARCIGGPSPIGVSCGALTGFVTSLLSIALASAVFLIYRLRVAQWHYLRQARKRARELVPTAGSLIGNVVGREDLCNVLMEDLRNRRTRRPHVLIGGVGTGKTALLVRLTELLAEHKAIPVPIRLRDVDKLDFAAIARKRFMDEIDQRLISRAEGEKVWRRLSQDGRIVVLADGLEEFLSGKEMAQERDNLIRVAIREAYRQGLPLLIASRPHDPLRGMDAAISELEPLSEEAALAYIAGQRSAADEHRLDWIVETADVAAAPLYLQITRTLYRAGRLRRVSADENAALDTRSTDRSTLRLRLLQTWEQSIVEGYLYRHVVLGWNERRAAIEWLSGLACVGLANDRLDVEFDQSPPPKIGEAIQQRLKKIGMADVDVRLAATWGAQLGLVETRGGGVRFQHSIMQAYLGSRLMDTALLIPEYMDSALNEPSEGRKSLKPGREFLIALVLHSRRHGARPAGSGRAGEGHGRRGTNPADVCALLLEAARRHTDNKALDIYAAALEIACIADPPGYAIKWAATERTWHLTIAEDIKKRWSQIRSEAPQTLEEGKLGLVHRFGDALRTLDERRREGHYRGKSAYAQLYSIACQETSYRVRHAVAQKIGEGGITAYQELDHILAVPAGCRECQKPGESGRFYRPKPETSDSHLDPGEPRRQQFISAWLAPLLAGSVEAAPGDGAHKDLKDKAEENLRRWLSHVDPDSRTSPKHERLRVSEEIALAQGFKYAANHRQRHPRPEMYVGPAECALEMLKSARYWFSQMTLIQALCLWALPDEEGRADMANADAIVDHWLSVAGSRAVKGNAPDGAARRPIHPFVAAAADLATRALETGHPERFLWIDESGIVARVGSPIANPRAADRKHHLWIPPSTGWSALDRRAQQLVADVLILLNLAERDSQPLDLDQRLDRANRPDLPPCLCRDRKPLAPERTVGMAERSEPGTNCADGCAFDLCPYPPMGAQHHRVELSEAFCRRQYTLLGRRRLRFRRRTAPWQGILVKDLRRFWEIMADRARGPRPGLAPEGDWSDGSR